MLHTSSPTNYICVFRDNFPKTFFSQFHTICNEKNIEKQAKDIPTLLNAACGPKCF